MHTLYIEEDLLDHPRVKSIRKRLHTAEVITCKHYGEVFNPKSQNFRIQKQKPALILAKKQGRLVLPTPESFGIGGQQNYYFSHMLNCLYDCRYCFLQGMYHSANYVLFVNYESFQHAIEDTIQQHDEPCYFFSGYDADSLAFEPISQFAQSFVPFFSEQTQAILELRTKSANVEPLLALPASKQCVVAFSFTPEKISKATEHGVPSVEKRIDSMRRLAEHGWQVGLRLDPLIYASDFSEQYRSLIETIFRQLPLNSVHSISVGPLRFPYKMWQKLARLYPQEKLLAHPFVKRNNTISYSESLESELRECVTHLLKKYIDENIIFTCSPLV